MSERPSPKGRPAPKKASAKRPSSGPQSKGRPGSKGSQRPQAGGKKSPGQKGDPKKIDKQGKPVGVRENMEEERRVGAFNLWLRQRLRETPAWATSAIIHAVILVLLMLITLAPAVVEEIQELTTSIADESEELEEIEEIMDTPMDLNEVDTTDVTEFVDTEVITETPEVSEFEEESAAPIDVELSPVTSEISALQHNVMNVVGSNSGKNPVGGRGAKSRAAMVASGGGTPGSEEAVARALKWIADHQNKQNGGWNFNHCINRKKQGPCPNPGTSTSEAGGTSMALLPFLGAGQTHKEGKYRDVVYAGLRFLGSKMKANGDLRGKGGNLYCHGLGAIVMCEAYALTNDKELAAPAQATISFIEFAQDKTGGGWRYSPGQPGDTSAVGWQVMGLKSGHLAYLKVNPKTVAGAINFLDLVQAGGGAYYGYTAPAGKRATTTSVGLLCRMYLGWKKDNPALQEGVKFLSNKGPSKNDCYYNYYATQILHHWQGEEWTKWNNVMRDQLVGSQVKDGVDKGSWWTNPPHASKGGRLYETAMNCMTLEIYYRYLPLYSKKAGDDAF